MIQLDFRSDVPVTNQIVAQIQGLIANGTLKIGDQLPTVRALATELRINFNTVARAYRILDESGIISTQQGRGTYILEKPSLEAVDQLRDEALEALANRYLSEAERLGFDAKAALNILSKQVEKTADQSNSYTERK